MQPTTTFLPFAFCLLLTRSVVFGGQCPQCVMDANSTASDPMYTCTFSIDSTTSAQSTFCNGSSGDSSQILQLANCGNDETALARLLFKVCLPDQVAPVDAYITFQSPEAQVIPLIVNIQADKVAHEGLSTSNSSTVLAPFVSWNIQAAWGLNETVQTPSVVEHVWASLASSVRSANSSSVDISFVLSPDVAANNASASRILPATGAASSSSLRGSKNQSSAPTLVIKLRSTAVSRTVQDLVVLNYALTLEHLEDTFYNTSLKAFPSQSDFQGFSSEAPGFNLSAVQSNIELIASHEHSHAVTLTSVISSLCAQLPSDLAATCKPVNACAYNFNLRNPTSMMNDIKVFAALSSALENTGVSAYDGAVTRLADKSLLSAAATIATVEARHASYVNAIQGLVPFPAAFDTPLTQHQVLCIAKQFIAAPVSACLGFQDLYGC
eukprot:GILK01009913.1.p1 GENE.GILK01009913.1~~GILK01009913.1.p1  ORF type:complete len:439 (+),score=43.80 GILK01009913.1:268-1584(+)